MPTALTYTSYVTALATMTEYAATDPNFSANIPLAINYAEDRINRELNLLSTVASNSSLAMTAGMRKYSIAAAKINVLKLINVITPAGTTNPDLGTRNRCTPVDESFLDAVYNSPTALAIPTNFAMLTDQTILFGPFPDQTYTMELVGTLWVPPLSAGNPTTWISTYIPDLFLAASMIWMTGFMKNFGAQSDDPRSGASWEDQYGKLRDSASVEDARRRFASAGWTSTLPSPATPPRT